MLAYVIERPVFYRWILDALSAETTIALFRDVAHALAERSRTYGVEDHEIAILCQIEAAYAQKRGICLAERQDFCHD